MQKNKIKFKGKNIENTVGISSASLHQQINCKCVGTNCVRPNSRGITLVALVITIIVMLILIGVTVSTVLKGDLFNIAKRASVETRASMVEEKVAEWKANKKIDEYLEENATTQTLEELLNDLETQQLITNEERKEIEEKMQVKIGDKEILFFYELPDGYTRCEYLESTGVQYINTGYRVKSNNIKLELELLNLANDNSDTGVFGNLYTGKTSVLIGKYNSSYYLYSRKSSNAVINSNTITKIDTSTWYKVEATFDYYANKKVIKVGNKIGTNGRYNSDFVESNGEAFTLFAGGTNTSIKKFIGRIKHGKIYAENNLVCDLIPCLDANGTPCMFDTVTGRTFYNEGEGEFLYAVAE